MTCQSANNVHLSGGAGQGVPGQGAWRGGVEWGGVGWRRLQRRAKSGHHIAGGNYHPASSFRPPTDGTSTGCSARPPSAPRRCAAPRWAGAGEEVGGDRSEPGEGAAGEQTAPGDNRELTFEPPAVCCLLPPPAPSLQPPGRADVLGLRSRCQYRRVPPAAG